MVAALAKDFGPLVNLGVARDHRAAASRGQQLAAAKAQHADVTPRTSRAPAHYRADRLARVFDNRQTVLSSQLHDARHVGQPAVQVRDDDGPRVLADRRGQLVKIEQPAVGLDVHQHRRRAGGFDRAEVAGKVVAGQDHFVAGADLEAAQRQFDGKRAGAAQRDELDVVPARQLCRQPLGMFARVASPATIGKGTFKRQPHAVIRWRPNGRFAR